MGYRNIWASGGVEMISVPVMLYILLDKLLELFKISNSQEMFLWQSCGFPLQGLKLITHVATNELHSDIVNESVLITNLHRGHRKKSLKMRHQHLKTSRVSFMCSGDRIKLSHRQ